MEECNLKLYCFQPTGHGEYSAFVMSYSLEEAEIQVRKALQEQQKKYEEYQNEYCNWDGNSKMPEWVDRVNMEGFGTEYYKVTVLTPGQVAFNANE